MNDNAKRRYLIIHALTADVTDGFCEGWLEILGDPDGSSLTVGLLDVDGCSDK